MPEKETLIRLRDGRTYRVSGGGRRADYQIAAALRCSAKARNGDAALWLLRSRGYGLTEVRAGRARPLTLEERYAELARLERRLAARGAAGRGAEPRYVRIARKRAALQRRDDDLWRKQRPAHDIHAQRPRFVGLIW